MKIVEKVVKINKALLKVGQIVEMEDTLSCDKFRAIVTKVSDFNLEVLRLKDLQEIVLSAEQLDHYEVRFMQLGYINDNKTKMGSTDSNPDTSVKRDDKSAEEARRDKTCEYNVYEDLVKQLNRNYTEMNRRGRWQ